MSEKQGREDAVIVEGLSKHFGKVKALDNLSIRVPAGEVYGLLGPNGSGKTTAIKIACGLLRQTSGRVELFGQSRPDKKVLAQVGYMPQETAVYMDNTVHENLALFGQLYGLDRERFARREAEVLRFVDLSGWRGALASNLSGGMRHRLSLACSLVHEPRLIFLDEPTVGVDPELRAAFWEYFREIANRGVTVVITTHYMDEASHCFRVGLLRQGRLVAEGAPEQLKRSTGAASLEDAFLAYARGDGQ
ncbi:MAG: ABC transporter ATP-binding protein [Euryarchaeota archaeon]|nr:ABC transporter ATP-binding protein [Euryarchaeota archaeon]